MEIVLLVIPWIAPPIVGAFIGYWTNRIALRMLFRPHRPKHVLGVRVPFTPGIIPKNRSELATAIGRAVAEELLTPEAIRQQLRSPGFRDGIRRWVGQQRRSLMETPITLSAEQERQLLAALGGPITQAIRSVLEQPAVRERLIEIGDEAIEQYVSRQNIAVRTAFRAVRPLAANIVNGLIRDTIDATSRNFNPQQVSSLMDNWIRSGSPKAIGDYIALAPDDEARIDDYVAERLITYLDNQLPALVKTLNLEILVTDRVNSFDVDTVEKLILDVTGYHLKWISWFGGLLGLIIGLLQLLLRLL